MQGMNVDVIMFVTNSNTSNDYHQYLLWITLSSEQCHVTIGIANNINVVYVYLPLHTLPIPIL